MNMFIRAVWAVAVVLSLVACGGNPEPSSQPNQEVDEKFLDEGEPDTPSEGF